MNTKKNIGLVQTSIKDASILRIFTVFFLLISLIPAGVLYYFYLQFKETGTIAITETNFSLTLIFIFLGVMLGFFTMRSILKRLVEITQENRRTMENLLGVNQVQELTREQNEIAVLAKSFAAITSRLEENIKSLEQTKKTLHSVMSKVGQGISNMQNIDTFLQLILETVTEALRGKVGVLMLFNGNPRELHVKTIYSTDNGSEELSKIEVVDSSVFESVIRTKSPRIFPRSDGGDLNLRKYGALFDFPMICSPLIYQDNVKGIISIGGHGDQIVFEDDEKNLLFNLTTQTAVAIENSRLSEDIEKTYFETISALALAVDAKDKYSRGHLDRVAHYCVLIAEKLGLEEGDIKLLRDGARLHDLGKIGIPDEVLCKDGPLSDQEWMLMRRHTDIGESIVRPIRSLGHLCDLIRHHHEKLDGTGYPDGLSGDEITPLVRILAIADIFDAMTTDRPYRKRLSYQSACAQMKQMKDQIDQDVVEALVEILQEKPLLSV